jgi:hypothetical protein
MVCHGTDLARAGNGFLLDEQDAPVFRQDAGLLSLELFT